jgi:hypothetical protein
MAISKFVLLASSIRVRLDNGITRKLVFQSDHIRRFIELPGMHALIN